eukprot:6532995-Ditylum_brightwellii.AAC.1
MGYQAGRQHEDKNSHDQNSFAKQKTTKDAVISDKRNVYRATPNIFKTIMGIMFQHTINKNKGRHNDQEHQHQHYVLLIKLDCRHVPLAT